MNRLDTHRLKKKLSEVCLTQSHCLDNSKKEITYNYETFQIYEFLPDQQFNERTKTNVKFTCLVCGKTFSRFHNLKAHTVNTHKNIETKHFVCTYCSKRFACRKYLNRHTRTHCQMFREKEKAKSNENELTTNNDNQELYSNGPELCEDENEILNILENDDCDNDVDESIFEPSITLECDVENSEEDSSMNSVLPFELGLADTILDSFSGLEDEVADTDQSNSPEDKTDETFTCHVCNDLFKSIRYLNFHLKKEHPDAQYICDYCGKNFEDPSKFQRHLRTHSKPYKCSKCPARFAENSRCVKHLAQHDEELNY